MVKSGLMVNAVTAAVGINGAIVHTYSTASIRKDHLFSIVTNNDIRPSVPRLHRIRYPTAIRRFIVSIYVESVDAQAIFVSVVECP